MLKNFHKILTVIVAVKKNTRPDIGSNNEFDNTVVEFQCVFETVKIHLLEFDHIKFSREYIFIVSFFNITGIR